MQVRIEARLQRLQPHLGQPGAARSLSGSESTSSNGSPRQSARAALGPRVRCRRAPGWPEKPVLPGTDLLLGGDTVPARPDPRSRAGRVLACLQDLAAERETAGAAAREQGQGYLQALEAGAANGRPPAAIVLAAQQLRVDRLVAAQQAVIGAWQAGRAAGTGSRLGRRPAGPEDTARVRRARARLADLPAHAAAEA
jgi:hypothetical protein